METNKPPWRSDVDNGQRSIFCPTLDSPTSIFEPDSNSQDCVSHTRHSEAILLILGRMRHVTMPLSIGRDRFDRPFIGEEDRPVALLISTLVKWESVLQVWPIVSRSGFTHPHVGECNYAKLNYNLQIRQLFVDIDA